LFLSSQSVYAQVENSRNGDKKRVDRKKTEARESGGDFYRVIIENNLFRPLGWRKPNRDPEYALVATWIGTRGTVAKALVMERKSSQLYYVARGEKVGDAIVENIAANQVSLKDSNDIVTLKAEAIQFLSSSSRSGERSGERGGSAADAERERNERGAQRGARRGAIGEDEALREWLRNASPEERRRKLEAIRRQGQGAGRRGGRGRNNDSGDKKDSKDEDEENWEEIKDR
jgi:hypothetical protein